MFTGPICGKLAVSQKNVTLNGNEVTITFKSGPHRSGRGFLLSYATDQYPGNFLYSDSKEATQLFFHRLIAICVVTISI